MTLVALAKYLSVGFLSAGLFLLLFHSPNAQSIPSSIVVQDERDLQELHELRKELSTLHDEIRLLSQHSGAVKAQPPRPGRAAEVATKEDQTVVEELDPEAAEADHFAQMEQHFYGEGRDKEWAEVAEASIRDVFNDETMDGTTLLEVECQKTMCRALVVHENEQAAGTFVEDLPRTAPFDTQGLIRVHEEQGEHKMTVYVARRGHHLALVD